MVLATVLARTAHLAIAMAVALDLAMVLARTAHPVIATAMALAKQIQAEMGISRNLVLAQYINN
jgi:hypothetical protein